MKTVLRSALFCAALLAPAVAAQAAVFTGPVYPPPGGVTYTPSGVSAANGTRIATYTNLDLGATDQLYWGMTEVKLSLDGSYDSAGETLSFNAGLSNLAGGIAVFTGSTRINQYGNFNNLETIFTLTVTDLSNNALALSPASTVGATYSPVLDVQGSFKVTQAFGVRPTGSGGSYTAPNPYYNAAQGTPGSGGPYVLNSVGAGFYYTENAVPEPASWAMMIGGFALAGGAMRSRRKVAVSLG